MKRKRGDYNPCFGIERLDRVECFCYPKADLRGFSKCDCRGVAHRFRPRYALANLGHPSGSFGLSGLAGSHAESAAC
jgi:hypothetical protein